MGKEIELKLQLDPRAAGQAIQWGEAQGDMTQRVLRSVYFDTPARSLAMAGLSLRTRYDGAGYIQTVKATPAAAAGLFSRREWEKDIGSEQPELGLDTPLAGLPPQTLDALTPLFSLSVERQSVAITIDGSLIEMAIDTGTVAADDRRADFCEIEFELKSGNAGVLFALARELDTLVSLRLGVVTKSERGYRLRDALAQSAKADRIRLSPDLSTADSFAAIASACMRQYRLNEDIVRRRRSPEALHQARVGLRRLRSAMTLFKPVFADDSCSHFNDELKWLAGTLGAVRDLDVLYDRARSDELRLAISRLRDDAYGALADTLDSARARALMIDLAEWVAIGAWRGHEGDNPVGAFAVERLDKLFRKFKKHSHGLAALNDESRHYVRKLAKKLRYGSEFFVALYTDKKPAKRHRRFIERLQIVQDQLGTLNDLAAAPHLLAKNGLNDTEGAQSVISGSGATDMLEKAELARDTLVELRPYWV